MKRFPAILLLILASCTFPLNHPKASREIQPNYSWEDCEKFSNNQFIWATIAKTSGGLTGLSTIPIAIGKSDEFKYSMMATGILFGALTTTSAFVSDHYSNQFTTYCGRDPTIIQMAIPEIDLLYGNKDCGKNSCLGDLILRDPSPTVLLIPPVYKPSIIEDSITGTYLLVPKYPSYSIPN